jgi:hypothetical protein
VLAGHLEAVVARVGGIRQRANRVHVVRRVCSHGLEALAFVVAVGDVQAQGHQRRDLDGQVRFS